MNKEGGRGDRAQMLIIGALLMAGVFVGLAILVNAAVYTENLSTRSSSTTGDVFLVVPAAFDDVDTTLARTNRRHNDSYDSLSRNYTARSGYVDGQAAGEHATRGAYFEMRTTARTNGTHLRQSNETRDFSDASGDGTDWQVVAGAQGVSDYSMAVNRADLYTDTGDTLSELLSNSFSLHVTDADGTTWELHVYENSENNVTVKPILDGTGQTACEVNASEVDIDLVEGTVGGAACGTLTFAEGLGGAIDIEYRTPTAVSGTYSMQTDVVVDPASDARYHEPGTGSPEAVPNLYAVTSRFEYTRSDGSFVTSRRTVVGEPAYAA